MIDNFKDLSLGIERTIDDLGRVILPKEMRDKMQFKKILYIIYQICYNNICSDTQIN